MPNASQRPQAGALAPLVLLPLLTLAVQHLVPQWTFMWLMAGALFLGFKWLTYATCRAVHTPLHHQLLYLTAWPGLAPDEFTRALPAAQRPTTADWFPGIRNTVAGLLLLLVVVPAVNQPLVRGWTGMIGMILTLHFGIFQMLALTYRTCGLDARPLMQQPLRSRSLAEFWGRRWNTAFAALADRHLFRPLSRKIGPRAALAAVFIGSGVIHEAVITMPAGGGYGLPTLYFALQAFGLLLEKHPALANSPTNRRILAWLVLVVPVGCLFPPAFVERVILPMLALLHPNIGTP